MGERERVVEWKNGGVMDFGKRREIKIRISIEMADILPVPHRTQTGGNVRPPFSLSEL